MTSRVSPVLLGLSLALAGGLLLRWPVLDAGLRDDDHVQRAMLDGAFPIERGPLDLFWFSGRSPAEHAALQDAGYLPWWASEQLRLGMLRPLSSGLVALDHRLLGDSPRAQHAHSLAWWALLILAAALALRHILPARAVAAALVLYALDESHAVPVAWLANRSALVSSAFALLALAAHLRWRSGAASPRWAWLSAAAAALSLLGGEYALCALAYVLAYEAVGATHDAWSRRARALLPTALPVVAYMVARSALGYGTHASSYYLSPLDQPEFAWAVLQRAPILLADLVWGVPTLLWFGEPLQQLLLERGIAGADTLRALPPWRTLHVGLGLGGLAALWLALRLACRLDPGRAGTLRWLIAGAVASLLPAAAALPSERTLLAAGFGVAALAGSLVVAASDRLRAEGPRLRWMLGIACLLAIHVGIAGVRSGAHAADAPRIHRALTRWAAGAAYPARGVEQLHVVVIASNDFTTAQNLPWVRRDLGAAVPRSYRVLSGLGQPLMLARPAPNVLELSAVTRDLSTAAVETLVRSRREPLSAGHRVRLPGMEVEVLAVRKGDPTRTRFRFDAGMSPHPRYLFLHARDGGLQRLRLPAVGARELLPAPASPRGR